jgi:hypothetical protein
VVANSETLDHPNIIILNKVVHENVCVFVVIEHCEGETLVELILADKMNKLSEVKHFLFTPTWNRSW